MLKKLLKPLLSFRAQIVAFVTIMLLITITALYYINRHLEERITQQVAEHIQNLNLAIEIVQSSLNSSLYLYDLVPQDGRLTLGPDESNIIHRILVTDADGKIVDSAERDDIGKQGQEVTGNLPISPFKSKRDADAASLKQDRAFSFPILTDKGERHIVIVVSAHKLNEVVREESRHRLIATAALGLLLILIVTVVTWRFTRPIRELSEAALRVSAGEFDFNVLVTQRDEVGALARTFNEMLAGLRGKRELEEKLRRAERSALAGRIASGIAHEIRSPLSFISLSIDYLRDKFAPSADVAHTEYTKLMDSIKEEIARLNQIVSDFLSYGRPARLKLRELDVRSLIEEVVNLVRAKAEQQGVRLSVHEVAGDGDDQSANNQLLGDTEQLKTCFSNLAVNAVQAMPDGGALTITLHPHRNNIQIEFADTGSGIAPEAIDQIFEPYFSTKETGIGLGLPLTKKLIEDHGGQIMVESEVGTGTTFAVILPRKPVADAQSVPLPQTALSTS